MKRIAILFFLLISYLSFSQKTDKVKKIKSIREKIFFTNDSIQNYKLFSIDGDYGHNGFTGPKATTYRFLHNWYNESFVHYVNDEKHFDDKGKLISESWYNKKDSLISEYKYEYDENDSLTRTIEKSKFVKVKDGNQITNITYNYQKKKQSQLSYWTDDPINFLLLSYSYNETGNLIKTQYISEEGNSWSRFYVYNKNNLIDKVILHHPTVWSAYNKKENSYTQKKDSVGTYYTEVKNHYKNNMIVEKDFYTPPEYNAPTRLDRKEYFQYDKQKNIIEHKKIPSSDLIFISKYQYNENNKLLFESAETIGFESDFDFEKHYTYKDNKLVSLLIKTKQGTYNVTFSYKYDDFENCIEQTKSVNGKKLFIWKKDFQYYE